MIRKLLALILMALLVVPQAALAQTSITASGSNPFVNGLRISLDSSDPRPSSAQSGTTLYALADKSGHNYITLRTSTGSYVNVKKSGTVSVSVGTNYFRIGNVYAYRTSAGKLAIEIDWWDSGGQSSQTITGATAASPCVLTTGTHGWNVGDRVGVRNITGSIGTDASRGINNHQFYVSAVTATTLTLEGANCAGLAYTSGGSVYKVPASATTGTTLTDGLLLKTGSLTRRLIATFQTDGAGNVLDGRATARNLSNVDNQEIVEAYAQPDDDSHTYASTTWGKWNDVMLAGKTRLYWTIATPRPVRMECATYCVLSSAYASILCTKNRDYGSTYLYYTSGPLSTSPILSYMYYTNHVSKGYTEVQTASTNWLQLWNASSGGSATFYGDDGVNADTADGCSMRVILPR